MPSAIGPAVTIRGEEDPPLRLQQGGEAVVAAVIEVTFDLPRESSEDL